MLFRSLYIDDTPALSLHEMRAKARRPEQRHGKLGLLVVDYLQLMAAAPVGGGRRYENRTQEVSAISRGLKALAKELRAPVLALSQLSRAPESRGGDHRDLHYSLHSFPTRRSSDLWITCSSWLPRRWAEDAATRTAPRKFPPSPAASRPWPRNCA